MVTKTPNLRLDKTSSSGKSVRLKNLNYDIKHKQSLKRIEDRVAFMRSTPKLKESKRPYGRYSRHGFLYSKLLPKVPSHGKVWQFWSARIKFGSHTLQKTTLNFPARTPEGRFIYSSKYFKIRWFRTAKAYQNTISIGKKLQLLKRYDPKTRQRLDIFEPLRRLFVLSSATEMRNLSEDHLRDALSRRPVSPDSALLLNFHTTSKSRLLDAHGYSTRLPVSSLRPGSLPTVRSEFRRYIPKALLRKYQNLPLTVDPDLIDLYFSAVSRLQSYLKRIASLSFLHLTRIPSFWARFFAGYFSLFQNSQVVGLSTLLKGTRLRYFSEATYVLRFRFNRERLSVVLSDENSNKTYCFFTPGLLVKFAQNRKSLRKKTSMKVLMMQFLRKLLIVLRLNKIQIISSGIPVLLSRLLYMLSQPLNHLITNPLTGAVIDEITRTRTPLNFDSVFFTRSYPYGYMPTRKRGRVKRKIRRKLVKLGRLID